MPAKQAQHRSTLETQELAFPLMTRDLRQDALPHPLQVKYREFFCGQDIGWMSADLSFLSTHTIRFVDSGDIREVNAFSVGYHSAFFNSLFKYSLKHSVHISLDWLSCISPSISAALGCISLRQCRAEVTDDNCLPLFLAADFILCQQLRCATLGYLRRRCSEDRLAALAVWNFARHLNLPDLVQASLKHVLRGFQELRLRQEFYDLDADGLQEILGHRMLNCTSELQVLQTISQWLLRHPGPDAHGMAVAERLLCCVRICQLTSEELAAALAEPLVRGNAEFAHFVRSYPLPTPFSKKHRAVLGQFHQPRWPQRVLLLLGGWVKRQGPSAFCQVYDPRADAWDLRSPDREQQQQQFGWLDERSHACCALLGDLVHVVGGYSGSDALKSVLCFDKKRPNLGWHEGSCMLQSRYYHCCAALHGFLYAIGGQTTERRLTHVERLQATENSWLAIEPLRRPRCEAAAIAFRDKVLVVGGFDGRAHLDTAEMYCPDTGAWTLVTGSLNHPRTGLALAAFDGAVYALCGRNSGGWRRCVERSEDARTWRLFCEVGKARSNFGCDILESRIYLLGGICGSSEIDITSSVEWVDPKTKLTGPAHPMPFPASGLTTCSLDLLDLTDFADRRQKRPQLMPETAATPSASFCPAPLRLISGNADDGQSEEDDYDSGESVLPGALAPG